MPYLKSVSFDLPKTTTFPFNVKSVNHGCSLDLDHTMVVFVGDNGSGKSTLLEALGYHLNLPLIGGEIDKHSGFEGAKVLDDYIRIDWKTEHRYGFFFRAEDFSHFVDAKEKGHLKLRLYFDQLRGEEIPDHIIDQMINNQNLVLKKQIEIYGQDLQAFSHGEAFLQIFQQRIKKPGIYLLDEPEAALSPTKQIALLQLIHQHLSQNSSQFIMSTHSPILMAYPHGRIYEITEEKMEKSSYEETEHFQITKAFLNAPEAFIRYL